MVYRLAKHFIDLGMKIFRVYTLFYLIFISSFCIAQENSFWPSQLGLPLKQVTDNINNEYKGTKVKESKYNISIEKILILQREASILAQSHDGQIYIIDISFSAYPADLFKELNTYFTQKHGKPIHPNADEMYKEALANNDRVAFWDIKKYTIMVSYSTFGLSIRYLDKSLYKKRQEAWSKQLNEEKKSKL